MPALVAGIHVLVLRVRKSWMAGTSPAMTTNKLLVPNPLPARAAEEGHLIACGLSGEPVPPVMISGEPQKKNS